MSMNELLSEHKNNGISQPRFKALLRDTLT